MEILGVLHNLASNDNLSSFNKEFSKNQDVDNNVEKKYYLCVPTPAHFSHRRQEKLKNEAGEEME